MLPVVCLFYNKKKTISDVKIIHLKICGQNKRLLGEMAAVKLGIMVREK